MICNHYRARVAAGGIIKGLKKLLNLLLQLTPMFIS